MLTLSLKATSWNFCRMMTPGQWCLTERMTRMLSKPPSRASLLASYIGSESLRLTSTDSQKRALNFKSMLVDFHDTLIGPNMFGQRRPRSKLSGTCLLTMVAVRFTTMRSSEMRTGQDKCGPRSTLWAPIQETTPISQSLHATSSQKVLRSASNLFSE